MATHWAKVRFGIKDRLVPKSKNNLVFITKAPLFLELKQRTFVRNNKVRGAQKLSLYSRAYSSKLISPTPRVEAIYREVFLRHRSRFIQLQIQNTTRGAKLQVVFDVIINLGIEKREE